MSNRVLPAQTPPTIVANLVVKWVELEHKPLLHDDIRKMTYLKRLLALNAAWGQAPQEFPWKKLDLTISNKVSIAQPCCPKWVKKRKLSHNAVDLVREIHVSAPISDIVSGVAYRLLADYFGDKKSFTFANKLIVTITGYKNKPFNHCDVDVATATAREFVKLLKSMTPAATTVKMICDGYADPIQRTSVIGNVGKDMSEEMLVMLAEELYASTKSAKLDLYEVNLKNILTIDLIPPLTWIRLDSNNSPDVHAGLVRKSASTLQFLDIGIRDANMLVYDKGGEDVLYPSLQYLHMYGCVRGHPNAKTCKTALFPVLRTLKLGTSYPYYDDVLFRGNSSTLKFLDFCLDRDTIVMLNKNRVFESKQMVLRHVIIRETHDNRDLSFGSEDETNIFLRNLVGAATRLAVTVSKIARSCIIASQNGQGFQNVRVFEVKPNGMPLFDVLGLLAALPTLVELRSGISELGPELEVISANELPDHVASTYCDAGKHLQVWKANSATSTAIDYVLLLALVSPKLWKIELKASSINESRLKIADALNSQVYGKYAPQLSKVLNSIRE